SRPDCCTASSEAPSAKWMKRAILRASFLSMNFSGSKPRTSAAMVQGNPAVSNPSIVRTPLLPASSADQFSSRVLPTADIKPTPVTTTRRGTWLYTLFAAFRVFLEVLYGFLHRAHLLRVLFRDGHLERLFEGHHEFHRVQRICA